MGYCLDCGDVDDFLIVGDIDDLIEICPLCGKPLFKKRERG